MTTGVQPTPPPWMAARKAPPQNQAILDIYWRKPDGWIIVGPGLDTKQAESFIRRGYQPLPVEFAYTDRLSKKTGRPETLDTVEDRLATDRFYWLIKNGGAHLLPVDQLVAYHWHITPPYGLSVSAFPQLEEYELPPPLWCPVCPGDNPPKNSEEELVQHAMISHEMTQQAARNLIQYAHQKPTSKVPLVRKKTPVVEESPPEMAQAEEPPPLTRRDTSSYTCPWCDWEFVQLKHGRKKNPRKARAAHMNSCRNRPGLRANPAALQVG